MKPSKQILLRLSLYWLLPVVVICVSHEVKASKGGDEKEKKGYVLKVCGFDVKKNYLTPFSLMQTGAIYKGSINPMHVPGSTPNEHSIITYQKGNTILYCSPSTKRVYPKIENARKRPALTSLPYKFFKGSLTGAFIIL